MHCRSIYLIIFYNFISESFMAWIHVKALRVFVESVLRYGLPVNFQGMSFIYTITQPPFSFCMCLKIFCTLFVLPNLQLPISIFDLITSRHGFITSKENSKKAKGHTQPNLRPSRFSWRKWRCK